MRSLTLKPATLGALLFLFWAAGARANYDLVVAQDGTGDYTTVQAAINTVRYHKSVRTTIFVKPGTYREKVVVAKGQNHVTLVGEDRDTTIITYDDHATINDDGSVEGTSDTPTVFIKGKDFGARNITFANTAGDVGPAIAIWVHSNHSHFRNCAFLGYQDTLCTTGKSTYFKFCYIEGAVDFIFGSSAAVFQRCTIHPLDFGFITAADTAPSDSYGLVFKGCAIHGTAAPGTVYLGRPWGDYARVVFLNCSMDAEIDPQGWIGWDLSSAAEEAFYAEYNCSGAGADPAGRVDWSQQLTADDAGAYTLDAIFGLPAASPLDGMRAETATPWYENY